MEIKWFTSEKERLAYIRGQQEEFKPKVVGYVDKETKKIVLFEKEKKKGRKKNEIQTD